MNISAIPDRMKRWQEDLDAERVTFAEMVAQLAVEAYDKNGFASYQSLCRPVYPMGMGNADGELTDALETAWDEADRQMRVEIGRYRWLVMFWYALKEVGPQDGLIFAEIQRTMATFKGLRSERYPFHVTVPAEAARMLKTHRLARSPKAAAVAPRPIEPTDDIDIPF